MSNYYFIPDWLRGLRLGDILIVRPSHELDEEQEYGDLRETWHYDAAGLSGETVEITPEIWDNIINDRDSIVSMPYTYVEENVDGNCDIEKEDVQHFSLDMFYCNDIQDRRKGQSMTDIELDHPLNITSKEKDPAIIQEMISKVDFNRFSNLLSVAGSDGNKRKFANKEITIKYLQRWAEAKYEFYLLFGRSFFLEKDINIEMNDKEFWLLVEDVCSRFPAFASLLSSFQIREWQDNEIKYNNNVLAKFVPQFKTGTKLSKFISKLVQNPELDIEISKVYQHQNITGRLVASIDPYDYLTMSINQHSWESCHNIKNGCYGTGPLSYMCDEATLIGYRCNGRDYNYNIHGFKFKGNSKSWRQCIYIDKRTSSVIFSRQYPDYVEVFSKELRLLVEDKIDELTGDTSKWRPQRSSYCDGLENMSDFHYSDVTNEYEHHLVKKISLDTDKYEPHWKVGSIVYCTNCGEPLSNSGPITMCGSCHREV